MREFEHKRTLTIKHPTGSLRVGNRNIMDLIFTLQAEENIKKFKSNAYP